jgi:hypothetical protein
LKMGIFQNGEIPVFYRHWKPEISLDCGSRVFKFFKVFQAKNSLELVPQKN